MQGADLGLIEGASNGSLKQGIWGAALQRLWPGDAIKYS